MQNRTILDEQRTQELFAAHASADDVSAMQRGLEEAFADMALHLLGEAQEKAMLGLMKQNRPFALGMPAYLVKALINDKESYYTADVLMGKEPTVEWPFIDDYLDLNGYQFRWGSLTQQEHTYDHDGVTLDYAQFGFSFEIVLRRFPRTDIWQTLIELFDFGDLKYEPFDGSMEMALLTFSSDMFDDSDQKRLRMWLAKTFIPDHLPELFRYLCVWLHIQQNFPAVFDRMYEQVNPYTTLPPGYMQTMGMKERTLPGAPLH